MAKNYRSAANQQLPRGQNPVGDVRALPSLTTGHCNIVVDPHVSLHSSHIISADDIDCAGGGLVRLIHLNPAAANVASRLALYPDVLLLDVWAVGASPQVEVNLCPSIIAGPDHRPGFRYAFHDRCHCVRTCW